MASRLEEYYGEWRQESNSKPIYSSYGAIRQGFNASYGDFKVKGLFQDENKYITTGFLYKVQF